MKTCTKCGECKPFDQFNKHSSTRDGYRPTCKPCKATELRDWRAANPAETSKKARDYYAANMREWFQQRYLQNKSAMNQKQRDWREANLDKHSAKEARRRAAKLCATPPWADHERINAVYAEAAALRALGLDVHVDHIVPLQGATVTGLHVHTNLQILLASDNLSKGNRLACP